MLRKTAFILFLPIAALLAQGGPPTGRPGQGAAGTATLVLTAPEASRLTWMREEEKLARDVYQFLAAKWNLRVFVNIAASETQHFTQTGTLLTRYQLSDPAAGKAAGEYWDPRIAALYAELTAKGALSVKDAIEVGVLIETRDIEDLQAGLIETTRLDIKRVYTNLMNASFDHLDAFEGWLELLAPR